MDVFNMLIIDHCSSHMDSYVSNKNITVHAVLQRSSRT